jgi:hypothetical protein
MKPWRRRLCRDLVVVRREVKWLVSLAEKRTAEAESPRSTPRFRALCQAEAEAIVGGELLAALAAGARVHKS